MPVLDERHQVDVILASNDEDPLAAVTLGIRLLQDVERVAALNVETMSSNPMPLRPELCVFRMVSVEVRHHFQR